MALLSSFAYQELHEGSGRGSINDNGGESQCVYKIAWADLNGFLLSLKGGWQKVNANTFTYIKPHAHPDFPKRFCYEAEYEGIGVSSRDANLKSSWEYAKVTAKYKVYPYDPDALNPNEILTEELDFNLDIYSLPEGSLVKTGDTSKTIDVPSSLLIPVLQYTITMERRPELPGGDVSLLMSSMGKVNASPFKGAAAKKMLFLGARARRAGGSFDSLNSKDWRIELKFAYRDIEWTKLFLPSDGAFVEVQFANGGAALYQSASLTNLLPT